MVQQKAEQTLMHTRMLNDNAGSQRTEKGYNSSGRTSEPAPPSHLNSRNTQRNRFRHRNRGLGGAGKKVTTNARESAEQKDAKSSSNPTRLAT